MPEDRTRFTLWLTRETLDELERTQRSLDKGSVARSSATPSRYTFPS